MKYAKFYTALIGAGATAGVAIFAPNTVAWQVATILVAAASAMAVRQIPNEPS